MADQDVYEGRVGLDINGFLDGLTQMEQAAQKTLTALQATFKAIEKTAKASLTATQAAISQAASITPKQPTPSKTKAPATVAQAATKAAQSAETAILQEARARAKVALATRDYAEAVKFLQDAQSKVNGKISLVEELKLLAEISRLLTRIDDQKKKAAAAAQKAAAKATPAQAAPIATPAASAAPAAGPTPAQMTAAAAAELRMASAKARVLAQAKDINAAIQVLNQALQKHKGQALSQELILNRQLTQLRLLQDAQQKRALAGYQAFFDKTTILAEEGVKREIAAEQEAATKKMDIRQRHINNMITAARVGKKREMDNLTREILSQRKLLEREYKQQEAIVRQQAQRMAEAATKLQGQVASGNQMDIATINVYRQAVIAAEKAATQEAAIRKRLTALVRQESTSQSVAIAKGYAEAANRARVLSGKGNFIQVLRASFEEARARFKEVEQDWHSIYRGGAQLTQVGGMMTRFSLQIARTSQQLAENSAEFDFWARRITAATNVANEQFGRGQPVLNTDQFKDAILEMGRDVGVIAPLELAKGWYTYQAAVGGAVESTADLAARVQAMDVILKASVITDTAPETIIRGVTSAMAQFGLEASQTEYALAVMQNTTQLTQADFGDMLEAFKMVGPQASRLGLTIGDVAAIFGTLADNGIRGSQAGRLLGSGLTNLVKPTKQMDAALQKLFITQQGLTGSWKDLLYQNGQFVGIYDDINEKGEVVTQGFLSQFAKASEALSPVELEKSIATIFGKESGKVFGTLIQSYREAAKEAEVIPLGVKQGWEEVVAASGQTEVALRGFVERTKGLNPFERARKYAEEFGTQGLSEFNKVQKAAEEAGVSLSQAYAAAYAGTTNSVEQMQQSLNDPERQIAAFGDQWKEVSQSTKVALGQLSFAFEELKERLGTIITTNALPLINFLKEAAYATIEWAKANPEVASALTKIAIGVAVVLGVVGPLLAAFGIMAQGIASLSLVWNGLGVALSFVKGVFLGFGNTIFSVIRGVLFFNPSLLALIGILYFLAAAWQNNWGNMHQVTERLVEDMKSLVAGLGFAFEGLLNVVAGVVNGNSELIAKGLNQISVGLVEALVVAPGKMLSGIWDWLTSIERGFENSLGSSKSRDLYVYGRNMIISFVNGMTAAMSDVWDAVTGIAEMISRPFRSYSPPKYGPLRKIQVWGTNLIGSLIAGMQQADLDGVITTAERIGEAIKRNVEERLVDVNLYGEYVGKANDLADDMLSIVREGGRVGEEFFEPLREGLGEWYGYIKEINLAYQEVYANERVLKFEQQKLKLLQAQNEQLRAQAKERQSIFDKYLRNSNDDFSDQSQQKFAIDPRSAEGKAKIEEMRRTLNTEDFQNWINFQKRLWEARDAAQEEEMVKEEEKQQKTVDTVSAQLEAAREEYELYVKIYEYAVKMYNLAKEQNDLMISLSASASGGGGGGSSSPIYGTPEDLERYLKEIEARIGKNTAIKDESMLKDGAGGDDIATLGDAAEQRIKEEERLSELERMNRRKRAEYEAALINATSEEERKRIKEEMDAWDAAYKDQKSALQERVAMTKEVEEATIAAADASKPGRIAEMQKEFQGEIVELLGEQTAEIADANELSENGVAIEEAQKKAKEQTRTEERKLRDLQAEGDRRRLDYEERIREAANDPEKIRRIQEEQEAWEAAYKLAIEAQQARVEASRRAEQDLAEVASEQKVEKPAAAPAGGGGGGGLGVDMPDLDAVAPPPKAAPAPNIYDNYDGTNLGGGTAKPRENQLEAVNILDDITSKVDEFLGRFEGMKEKLATAMQTYGPSMSDQFVGLAWELVKFLGQAFIEGLKKLGEAAMAGFMTVGTLFGQFIGWVWDEWKKGIDEQNQKAKENLAALFNGIGEWLFGVANWDRFKEDFSGGWDRWMTDLGEGWNVFSGAFTAAWVWLFGGGVMTSFTNFTSWLWTKWGELWGGISTWFATNFMSPLGVTWGQLWGTLTKAWDDFKGLFGLDWGKLWGILKYAWDTFSAPFSGNWGAFFTGLSNLWGLFKAPLEAAWGELWGKLKEAWDGFNSFMSEKFGSLWEGIKIVFGAWALDMAGKWGSLVDGITTIVAIFIGAFTGSWSLFWGGLSKDWEDFIGPVQRGWDVLISKIGEFFGKISSFASSLANFKFPSLPKGDSGGSSGSSGGGKGGGAADGSHAKGLSYVPFDGYRAILHRGERVLTAAENAGLAQLTIGIRQLGENLMSALQRQEQTQQQMFQTINQIQNHNKQVTVNVGQISSEDPNSGRAFLNQLAFLS